MNTKSSEGLIYKAVIVIIIIALAAFITLIAVSTVRHESGADETTADTTPLFSPSIEDGLTDAPEVPEAVETEDTVPVTTAEITADKAPEETTPVNSAPVDAPSQNSTEEWDKFLAGFEGTVLSLSDDAGQAYVDKLVFLGDSTTYGLRAYKMLSGGKNTDQVWTPTSGTLTLSQVSFAKIVYPESNTEVTIKEAVTAKKPEYLVITLGVNGVSFMDEKYFKSEYKKMLETIIDASPDTKIICQSIFPVARTYAHLGSINNEKIRTANHWIVEVAHEVGVKFVDTYSVLCDSEGWLPESYHNGDGMHLNETSFTLELNNLRTHAYPTE